VFGRGRGRKDIDKVPTYAEEAFKHVKHSTASIGSVEHDATSSFIIESGI
jgi:hypothetical protein